MPHTPYKITIKKLAVAGRNAIPADLLSSTQLIYSSPATLAFNSPGARGFGVKRAGLAIPGSIMLLVSPGCCGRNTKLLQELPEYSDRFFFLLLDETDIVTGRHLKKIPQAVEEICSIQKIQPAVVMICMTCVDALLGTDMERVCRKATRKTGLPVVPCYMYALTREGRKPPMTAVCSSVYSLLEKTKRDSHTVNLLGYFAPLLDDCELYVLLKQAGVRTVQELSRCRDFDEYKKLSQANFNLVLHPEARLAAQDMEQRLGIPSIELTRLYQIDKIHKQYEIFSQVLNKEIDDSIYRAGAEQAVADFKAEHGDAVFAVGEMMNGNAFELALALVRYGLRVDEIYATVTAADFVYIRHLAEYSPDTQVYSNLSPSMLYYDGTNSEVTVAIGEDSSYYHPNCASVSWRDDRQPFGYAGVTHLFRQLQQAVEKQGTV